MTCRLPLAAVALLVVLLVPAGARAADDLGVQDAHVGAALEAAGANRPELERALAHFPEAGAAGLRRQAVRFLVANMVDKGYVVTELRDASGKRVAYDPLAYADFGAALAALDALEAEHGTLEFARDRKVLDVETIRADFLIRHVEEAFAAWEQMPEVLRVDFRTFCDHVLPYRGSEEPIDDWIAPLRRRYAARARALGADLEVGALYRELSQDVHRRVSFDERYYLHPTDQGFTEMGRSGQGRCEDITNMVTYAARSLALATAADYTPYWAHRDNNHAWNVLLDREGRGSAPANAHAAKVFRKTYAIQRDSLPFVLPEGREAPNRFLASPTAVDVTDQYAPTTDVRVALDPGAVGAERIAYLCVFNGGDWRAIHWARLVAASGEGPPTATFERMGRNVAYLPAVHDGERLVPAAPALLLTREGEVRTLAGAGPAVEVVATSVAPRKVSPDTQEVTPVSVLERGTTYTLQRWAGAWERIGQVVAGEEAPRFEGLPSDGLYWLVAEGSRRLERIFTIEAGRQRWW